jgi:hypothetical protein
MKTLETIEAIQPEAIYAVALNWWTEMLSKPVIVEQIANTKFMVIARKALDTMQK